MNITLDHRLGQHFARYDRKPHSPKIVQQAQPYEVSTRLVRRASRLIADVPGAAACLGAQVNAGQWRAVYARREPCGTISFWIEPMQEGGAG